MSSFIQQHIFIRKLSTTKIQYNAYEAYTCWMIAIDIVEDFESKQKYLFINVQNFRRQ